MDKEEITQENLDIARVALGAYQSYGEKLARAEVTIYRDGYQKGLQDGKNKRIQELLKEIRLLKEER